jgi:hypothetical protein
LPAPGGRKPRTNLNGPPTERPGHSSSQGLAWNWNVGVIALPTSLAFGGSDRRTVYLGSLALPHLLSFRSPVAGLALD